jgi:hypothetical protein
MLPPSKTEIEETIEKAANSASERQKAENKKDTSEIALTFNDAYQSERKKPDKTDKVKRALDAATLVLLFATALFTALA